MTKIIPPAVTVFDKREKPDYEANKKVIDFLIQGAWTVSWFWVPPASFPA